MDVSQVKDSASTPFSWGINYQDTETEKFAVFLDDRNEEPESVRESRSRKEDDSYEKPDYADKEIDERDDRDDLNASDTKLENKRPVRDELLVAATAPLPITPIDTNTETSGTKATPTAQVPAMAAPMVKTPPNIGTEGTKLPTGTLENSEKNFKDIAASSVKNEKGSSPTPHATVSETLSADNKEPVATNKTAVATGTGTETKPTPTATSPAQAADTTKQQTPNIVAVASKTFEGAQAVTSATQAATAQESTIGKPLKAGETNFLEKMRADENAKLTEKEVLSSKISEMLRSSSGKITATSASNASSAAKTSSLISGQNSVASSVIPGTEPAPTATAIGTVTNATTQAEIPISMQPAANSPAPVVQQAPLDPAIAGNATPQSAAIPSVASSSANSVSQSATATQVSMQAGSPAEQVSTQITSAVRRGLDQIKIQLNPAELGLIDIKLEIGRDGRVMATIAANNQESLDLLQQDSKSLEQALKDAGFETDSDSLNFSLNQQNDQGEGFQTANRGDDQAELEQSDGPLEPHQLQAYRSASDSNLDIQV